MLFKPLRMKLMELDMKHSELAREIGMVESTLSDRMTGRYPFTAWEIQAAARVLGIPPEQWHLYFFDRESKRPQ